MNDVRYMNLREYRKGHEEIERAAERMSQMTFSYPQTISLLSLLPLSLSSTKFSVNYYLHIKNNNKKKEEEEIQN
jgi:hypothetical protein